MATNIVHEQGNQLRVQVTAPTTPASGDPVRVGDLPGVALTDEDDEGYTTVKFDGTADLVVEAEANAITVGEILYYDDADGQLNNSASGNTRFGYALEAIDNAATATILVKIGY